MKNIFLAHSRGDRELISSIKSRLQEEGQFDFVDSLDLSANYELGSSSEFYIKRASVVVAFLANATSNTLYEVGMAVGAGKTILIASHDLESLPTELQRVPFVLVSGNVELDTTALLKSLHSLKVEDQHQILPFSTPQDDLRTYYSNPEYFDSMSEKEFRDFLIAWLQNIGFSIDKSRDPIHYGTDIVLRSSHDDSIVIMEVKRYNRQSRVSIKDVMALFGAATAYKAEKAVLITSSSFTVAASEMAKTFEQPKLYLLTMEDVLQAVDPSSLFA